MSDFTAWAIAALFGIAFAPWYVVVLLLLGLAVAFVSELP